MSRSYRMLWVAVAMAGLCVSQTKPPGPPTVDVELSVSGGDGRPLANSKLKLKLIDVNPFGSIPFEVEVATDPPAPASPVIVPLTVPRRR